MSRAVVSFNLAAWAGQHAPASGSLALGLHRIVACWLWSDNLDCCFRVKTRPPHGFEVGRARRWAVTWVAVLAAAAIAVGATSGSWSYRSATLRPLVGAAPPAPDSACACWVAVPGRL